MDNADAHPWRCPGKTDVTRKEEVVVVIDYDASVRAALKGALRNPFGLKVKLYRIGECLPGRSHYELLGARCEVARNEWPQRSRVTGKSSFTCRSFSSPAMETSRWPCAPGSGAGGSGFLSKPISSHDLLDAVFTALEQDRTPAKRVTHSGPSPLVAGFHQHHHVTPVHRLHRLRVVVSLGTGHGL